MFTMESDGSVDISAEIHSLLQESPCTSGEIENSEYVEGDHLCYYKILRLLGTGSSSNVVLGLNTLNNENVAIKIIKRKNGTEFTRTDQRIFREVLMVSLINHPHIISLKDFLFNDFYYFLIFEYVNGKQLYDVIVNEGHLNENIARRYFRQILSAVDYIHKNNIVHRDLKIENILLDECDNIKLIDFGLSNFYDSKMLLNTFCGSLYFAAPELLSGQRYHGPEIDVWSLGIVLYVLLNGTVPFDDKDVSKLQEKIQNDQFSYSMSPSSEARWLIEKMLQKDPLYRCNLQQIIESDWANIGYDIPINSYYIQRYHLYQIDQQKIQALADVTKFQFRNIEREIVRYHSLCSSHDKGIDVEYWSRRPVISIYYMLLEHFEDTEITCSDMDTNDFIIELEERDLISDMPFSDDNTDYLRCLHNFVIMLVQKERKKPCGKFYKARVFSSDSIHDQKLCTNPQVRNTYMKGILHGIRIKNVGSHNALKKILLDIFNQNNLTVKIDDKHFLCSFSSCKVPTFKVSLYYNVIMGEYYVNLAHVSGERQEFKKFYNTMYDSIKKLEIL